MCYEPPILIAKEKKTSLKSQSLKREPTKECQKSLLCYLLDREDKHAEYTLSRQKYWDDDFFNAFHYDTLNSNWSS